MAPPTRILIADDEAGIRMVLTRYVMQIYPSATVVAVADGQAALADYDQHGADLVITNQSMPHMSGLDLIIALRTRNATLPIIMVSGDLDYELAALTAGATAFLAKPFTRALVVQTLRQVLPP